MYFGGRWWWPSSYNSDDDNIEAVQSILPYNFVRILLFALMKQLSCFLPFLCVIECYLSSLSPNASLAIVQFSFCLASTHMCPWVHVVYLFSEMNQKVTGFSVLYAQWEPIYKFPGTLGYHKGLHGKMKMKTILWMNKYFMGRDSERARWSEYKYFYEGPSLMWMSCSWLFCCCITSMYTK